MGKKAPKRGRLLRTLAANLRRAKTDKGYQRVFDEVSKVET
jgi:hypothetical protein